jgi:hypothetical protein
LVEAQYPLFIPPSLLSRTPHREWSKVEADLYKDWLVGSVVSRTDALLRLFGVDLSAWEPRQLLLLLGEHVEVRLGQTPFSEPTSSGTRSLTNAGYALAADIGLLTARLLLRRAPEQLRWEIVRRPKTDASYNLPVLAGFSNHLTLDPVGGSVAEANAVLAGRRRGDAWARILDFWGSRVVG